MPAETVNRDLQLSHVLSVRLTDRQLKRLQKTLRNFEIDQGSWSDQLRTFFRLMYFKSQRAQVQPLRHVERERDSRGEGEDRDPEEEAEYEAWFTSMGEEQIK